MHDAMVSVYTNTVDLLVNFNLKTNSTVSVCSHRTLHLNVRKNAQQLVQKFPV